tara:strand:- start:5088 stop:5258 length:171 start_codon:yes stop_codon:yes gene_type:complete
MITSLIMMLFACECGDKSEKDTSEIPTEVVDEQQEEAESPSEESNEEGSEEIPTEE